MAQDVDDLSKPRAEVGWSVHYSNARLVILLAVCMAQWAVPERALAQPSSSEVEEERGPDADLPDQDLPDNDLPDTDLPDTDLPDRDLPDGDLPSGEDL
jgi:hypothetical protein